MDHILWQNERISIIMCLQVISKCTEFLILVWFCIFFYGNTFRFGFLFLHSRKVFSRFSTISLRDKSFFSNKFDGCLWQFDTTLLFSLRTWTRAVPRVINNVFAANKLMFAATISVFIVSTIHSTDIEEKELWWFQEWNVSLFNGSLNMSFSVKLLPGIDELLTAWKISYNLWKMRIIPDLDSSLLTF